MTRISVIGQLTGASGLGFASGGAHCKWRLVSAPGWKHVCGLLAGSSQTAHDSHGAVVWQHPVDACFDARVAPSTLKWPHIEVEIRVRDGMGRSDICGYAMVPIPRDVGQHDLSIPVWRPRRSLVDRMTSWFGSGSPALKTPQILVYGVGEELGPMASGGADERGESSGGLSLARRTALERLQTEAGGMLHVNLGICVQQRLKDDADSPALDD